MSERSYTFDLNKIIEDFTSSFGSESPHRRPQRALRYNRYRTEKELLLEFILPGYKEHDIVLEFIKDSLVITAKIPAREVIGIVEQQEYRWKDIPPLHIPVSSQQYDHSKITAHLRDGILSVRIPSVLSTSEKGAKKIKIIKGE